MASDRGTPTQRHVLLFGAVIGVAATLAALVEVSRGVACGDRDYRYVEFELRDWRAQIEWGRT